MTIELWILIASAGLTWLLIMVAATPGLLADPMWAAGNRDTPAKQPAWADRADRAAQNMKENLPLFAILVLVLHVSGSSDWLSTLGAEIFLGARLVHALVYMVGIAWVRTGIWGVSIVGMGMMAASLF